jgi:hypothetical protein
VECVGGIGEGRRIRAKGDRRDQRWSFRKQAGISILQKFTHPQTNDITNIYRKIP